MGLKAYPVIDLAATGDNIRRLRMARGLTVRDLQSYFGFARAAGDLQVAEGRDPADGRQSVRARCAAGGVAGADPHPRRRRSRYRV